MEIRVQRNNVDKALKVLKRKLMKEGIFKEMRSRSFYEKPSEKAKRKKREAARKVHKSAYR